MKTRNPKTRNHLKINKYDEVLEVGGGHNPHHRSNVVVDKHIESNYHRSGDVHVYHHQRFIHADGEALPFADKSFDYTICNQVLEHVENPEKFLSEQSRVSKRGYIETPSLIGEYLFPKESHKWLILEIDGKLVLMDKERVDFKPSHDLGELFLHYLPQHSIAYKILLMTHGNIHTVRYEWEDSIELIVNPTDEFYIDLFSNPWKTEHIQRIIPKKGFFKEGLAFVQALGDLTKGLFKNRVFSFR